MSQRYGLVIFKSKGQGHNALITEMAKLGKIILAHNLEISYEALIVFSIQCILE